MISIVVKTIENCLHGLLNVFRSASVSVTPRLQENWEKRKENCETKSLLIYCRETRLSLQNIYHADALVWFHCHKVSFSTFKLAECGKAGWWVDCSIIQSNVGIIVFTECWTLNLQPSVVFGKENIFETVLCKVENILPFIIFLLKTPFERFFFLYFR